MISCKYLFLGHHKCSSTYVGSIFSEVAHTLRKSISESNSSEELRDIGNMEVDFFLLLNSNRILVEEYFRDFKKIRGIHIIRDPRDIVISGYFSHLNSHPTDNWPELIPHREGLKKLDKISGIKLEMDFSKRFLDDIDSWDDNQNTNMLTVKMEEFTVDPYTKWLEIFEFLGVMKGDLNNRSLKRLLSKVLISVSNKYLGKYKLGESYLSVGEALEIVYKNRFEAKSKGRRLGQEDVHHHYRKGVPGDWKNHFNDELRNCFKEKYNHILLKYKYETNADW